MPSPHGPTMMRRGQSYSLLQRVSPQVLGFHSANAPLLRPKGCSFSLPSSPAAKGKRNAERRRFLNRRNRCCGSRLAGRAHLPAFCCGSRQRDVAVPQAQHRAKLPGTWPRPVPVQWCTPRAGRSAGRLMPELPGAQVVWSCPRAPHSLRVPEYLPKGVLDERGLIVEIVESAEKSRITCAPIRRAHCSQYGRAQFGGVG
jgi:hypothetical protein